MPYFYNSVNTWRKAGTKLHQKQVFSGILVQTRNFLDNFQVPLVSEDEKSLYFFLQIGINLVHVGRAYISLCNLAVSPFVSTFVGLYFLSATRLKQQLWGYFLH